MKPRCRHERTSWIIFSGSGEWCYVCGAFRKMKRVGPAHLEPASNWVKPTGDKANNPWESLKDYTVIRETTN